ncbi:MAG: YigZ family protein [Planctomycetota bacterium]
MPRYWTLQDPVDLEGEKIKGSRFWAFAVPVETEAAAKAFVDGLRQQHKGASHACYAWRLGLEEVAQSRANDDGEPGGTAGRPILREVEALELRNVCVVVLRWFGGTKLGTGGLARAYGGAARALLEQAPTRELRVTQDVRVRFAYPDTALVEGVLREQALSASAADYGADVRLTVPVPPEDLPQLERALREATAGRVELEHD